MFMHYEGHGDAVALAKALGTTVDYLAGMYDDESETEPAELELV